MHRFSGSFERIKRNPACLQATIWKKSENKSSSIANFSVNNDENRHMCCLFITVHLFWLLLSILHVHDFKCLVLPAFYYGILQIW